MQMLPKGYLGRVVRESRLSRSYRSSPAEILTRIRAEKPRRVWRRLIGRRQLSRLPAAPDARYVHALGLLDTNLFA